MGTFNIMRNLDDQFKISYKNGTKMEKFIDGLLQLLPEESYFYNTTKESWILGHLENILEIGKNENS